MVSVLMWVVVSTGSSMSIGICWIMGLVYLLVFFV